MPTPFDELIENIKSVGYHNHRKQIHSDIISRGILRDLKNLCEPFKRDLESGKVKYWFNVPAPGDRGRKIDLLVGEPLKGTEGPDLSKIRIVVENKSVITAHRNRSARFDDLKKLLDSIYSVRKETIIVATVLIGVAPRYLNVADQVKKIFRGKEDEFRDKILPRLSSGDESLWKEFKWTISKNRIDDPRKTMEHFMQLPRRNAPALTHENGFDFVLLVPVHIDNVKPPYIPRPNSLEIDVDKEYRNMLDFICRAYLARWHL